MPTDHPKPTIAGIHHLKFPVADIGRSTAFYAAVFGAARIEALDHVRPDGTLFAVLLDVPGLGTLLELRLDAAAAGAQAGFDPVTCTVATRADLVMWHAHLEALGVSHSPVLVGVAGWLLAFADPDARRLRLYTLETHGPELAPSWDDPWVKS